MIGALMGMIVGIGLLLMYRAYIDPHPPKPIRLTMSAQLLAEAGFFAASPITVPALMLLSFLITSLTVVALTGTPLIALIIGAGAAALPVLMLKTRAESRSRRNARLWPDVIDDIITGVRAGVPLPEILIRLGDGGPEALRQDFRAFAADFRVSGNFSVALNQLKYRFASREADRLIEVLRISREVGGADLGNLLRDLSAMMRLDLQTRGELESRQSWTRNAARLAVVSPWLVLLMITTRTGGINVYSTAGGSMVLLIGLAVSVLAYWLMNRTAKLSGGAV